MLKTAERLNLILTMNKYRLDLSLLQDYASSSILLFCNGLEKCQTPQSWYAEYPAIQNELISDDRFFLYLEKMNHTDIETATINLFLKELRSNGESAMDYSIGRLLSSMAVTAFYTDAFYEYLKYFSALSTSKVQKATIVKNLHQHWKLLPKTIAELDDAERLLFLEPCFGNTSLIPNDIGRALDMLAHQDGLLDIVRFFHENEHLTTLSMEAYESFCLAPHAILDKLKKLHKMLSRDSTYLLFHRWKENNYPLYDIEVLSDKLAGMNEEQIEDALSVRSRYINLVYGGRISNIPLSDIPAQKEDILIYAITAKKNGFIRLVEDNFEIFSSVSPDSILFSREFYSRHVNLNTLNAKNLLDCRRMITRDMSFTSMEADRVYTFEEVKALYHQPVQYFKLYAKLNIPRVDMRLIVLRQLSKINLLADVASDEQLGLLAGAFSQKPLSAWREQDFAHIEGLTPQDAVGLLLHGSEVAKLIPQMETRTDARLVLRNWNSIQGYTVIQDMKRDLMKIDGDWKDMVDSMGFSEQFLVANLDRVIEFLCQNGAEIVRTYYHQLYDDSRREAMRRIVKALLLGEFNTLKYYEGDLRIEIDHAISGDQKAAWMENIGLTAGNLTVREHDDFFSTMLLGTMPQRTCLSYIDGKYNECLLANFDSNKKVLYAKLDGKIVGRALIRLTKGRFKSDDRRKDSGATASLSFVDLDAGEGAAEEKDSDGMAEHLVLFLESSYAAYIPEETQTRIKTLFIELTEQKAAQMGAMLVLSGQYADSLRPGYTRTMFHIYISRSKAGTQYLDSLNGSASVSDEGGYRANSFYIRNEDLIRHESGSGGEAFAD